MWAEVKTAFKETAQVRKVHFYVRDRNWQFWGKTGDWVKKQANAMIVSGKSQSAVWDYVDSEIGDDENIWLEPIK